MEGLSTSNQPRFKVCNIERFPAMGGDPSEFDRGCVLDLSSVETHPITGESQHKAVYFGTLADCWRWVEARGRAKSDQVAHEFNNAFGGGQGGLL